MMLSRDKVLSKQILAYHRIPTPHFAVFRRGGAIRIPKALRYPLFVKSATEDASLGISQASVVEDAARLTERIGFIHEHTQSDALVEEYVEGRELYVGVLGNERIRTLTPWEFIFGELKAGRSAIATRKAKWDRAYQKRHGITSGKARGPAGGLAEKLDRLARRIYRALHMTGYARIDFRVRADGTPLVLEANANPNLERAEDFADAALHDGIAYPALLEAHRHAGARISGEVAGGLTRRGLAAEGRQTPWCCHFRWRSSQPSTSACHCRLFAGFRIQWFSSGKYTKRLSIPRRCSAVNVARPCESGTR